MRGIGRQRGHRLTLGGRGVDTITPLVQFIKEKHCTNRLKLLPQGTYLHCEIPYQSGIGIDLYYKALKRMQYIQTKINLYAR